TVSRYRATLDDYRSVDEQAHWIGPLWCASPARGLWSDAGYEHGFARDNRGAFEANALQGSLECQPSVLTTLKASARAQRTTFREELYAASLELRRSFLEGLQSDCTQPQEDPSLREKPEHPAPAQD